MLKVETPKKKNAKKKSISPAWRSPLEESRRIVSKYITTRESLVDALIAERREEAKRDRSY
jgi:hypothetical protein